MVYSVKDEAHKIIADRMRLLHIVHNCFTLRGTLLRTLDRALHRRGSHCHAAQASFKEAEELVAELMGLMEPPIEEEGTSGDALSQPCRLSSPFPLFAVRDGRTE